MPAIKPPAAAKPKPPAGATGGRIAGVRWQFVLLGVAGAIVLGLMLRRSLAGSGTSGGGTAQPSTDTGSGSGADSGGLAAIGDEIAAINDQLGGIQETIFGLVDVQGQEAAAVDQLGSQTGALSDQVGGLALGLADVQSQISSLDSGTTIVDGSGAQSTATAPTNQGPAPAAIPTQQPPPAAVTTTGAPAPDAAASTWADYPPIAFPPTSNDQPAPGYGQVIDLTPAQTADVQAGNFPVIDFPPASPPTPSQGQATASQIAAGQAAVNTKPKNVPNKSSKGNLI